MQKTTLIIAVIMFTGSAIAADSSHYLATLAQPLTQKKEFIVNGNLFRCEGSSCTLNSAPMDASSVNICHGLMREVGTLTAYVADGKAFDTDKLAKCNVHK